MQTFCKLPLRRLKVLLELRHRYLGGVSDPAVIIGEPSTKPQSRARCTSAAPIYFESYRSPAAGVECRDGGLTQNNPVQIAVDESKDIWGENVPFDVILSIGSGEAKKAPTTPSLGHMLPKWINELLQTQLATMNGQLAWKEFSARRRQAYSDPVKASQRHLPKGSSACTG